MKRKTVALMTVLTLAVSLSACGSTPTSSNNSDSSKIEELEQRIDELEAENKELRAQIEDSDSAEESQQAGNEVESLIKTTIESPETSGVCGADLTWYYQNGVLVIKGTGEMTDYHLSWDENTPWLEIRNDIGWVIIDEGVTSIGDDAFAYLGTLSKVILPSTLESIPYDAFDHRNDCTIIYDDKTYTPDEFIDSLEKLGIKVKEGEAEASPAESQPADSAE